MLGKGACRTRWLVVVATSFAVGLGTASAAAGAPPANDDFADAQLVTEIPSAFSGVDTTEATLEPGEVQPDERCGFTIENSVWYRYTAPPTGVVTLEARTRGSSFDTAMAVYTANSPDGYYTLACSDDVAQPDWGTASLVVPWASDGTTYYIQVGGKVGSSEPTAGSLTLSFPVHHSWALFNSVSAITTSRDASFGFWFSGTPQCKLDSGAWFGCWPTVNLYDLPDGPHTFSIRGVVDGVPDDVIDQHHWVIDATGPIVTIAAPKNGAVFASSEVDFTFGTSEPAVRVECAVEYWEWFDCESPLTIEDLPDGQYQFSVRAFDALGNVDTEWGPSFSVDTTPPQTSIDGQPTEGGPVAAGGAQLSFLGDGTPISGYTFACRIDGGAWAPCTTPQTYAGLAEGRHELEVRARDQVGHEDPTPARRSWIVDLTAPDSRITPQPRWVQAAGQAFTFSADEAVASWECSLDGGAWVRCTTPYDPSSRLADGEHELRLRARDLVGNLEGSPAVWRWTLGASRSLPTATPPATVAIRAPTALRRALAAGMLRVPYTCAASCRPQLTLDVTKATAARLGLRSRRIASGRAAQATTSGVVVVRLSAAARKALRGVKSVRGVLNATIDGAASARRSVTLRR